MVKNESQTIKYRHPFAAVTSSLWSKYDAHKYVKEVEGVFNRWEVLCLKLAGSAGEIS